VLRRCPKEKGQIGSVYSTVTHQHEITILPMSLSPSMMFICCHLFVVFSVIEIKSSVAFLRKQSARTHEDNIQRIVPLTGKIAKTVSKQDRLVTNTMIEYTSARLVRLAIYFSTQTQEICTDNDWHSRWFPYVR
jgi:hypothetical protein